MAKNTLRETLGPLSDRAGEFVGDVGKELWHEVRDGLRTQVQNHPYRTLGAAFFVGFAVARSHSHGVRSLLWTLVGKRLLGKAAEALLHTATKRLLTE